MSIRRLALAGAATGAFLGTVAGLAGWTGANIQLAGATATIMGGALFIVRPDTLACRRQ